MNFMTICKFVIAVVVAFCAFSVFSATPAKRTMVHGDGKIIEQVRPLANFSKLQVQNNLNIQLVRDTRPGCIVRVDANVLPHVITHVENDTLIIKLDDRIMVESEHDLVITVNTGELTTIDHHGSGDIDGHDIHTKNLVLNSHGAGDVRLDGKLELKSIFVSGSGDIKLDNVVGDKVVVQLQGEADVEINGQLNLQKLEQMGQGDAVINGIETQKLVVSSLGSGDVKLTGKATELNLLVNGSADVNATELDISDALVKVMGSGDITVKVSKSLNASVLGSGDVSYIGRPKVVETKILGSGRVHHTEAKS